MRLYKWMRIRYPLEQVGEVYGLMGAMVVYLFSSGLYKIRKFRQPIVQSLLMNLFISFLPNVSWQAHLGGFVGGMIATLFFTKNTDRQTDDIIRLPKLSAFN